MMSDILRVLGPHLPITGRVRIAHSSNQISWPEISPQQSIYLKKPSDNNRSGDVVADCRKVVTGTPSNDTDSWGLNINGVSEHLSWKESSWRERKRGERNLSESLPRHKLCCSTNVWERISCVRRKERAHKPLKGAWVEISSHSWGRTVSLYSVPCHWGGPSTVSSLVGTKLDSTLPYGTNISAWMGEIGKI